MIILYGGNPLRENTDGSYSLISSSAEIAQDLCPNERFADQQIPNYGFVCSGFLLSTNPPWIGTAAHCVDPEISNYYIVFGFNQISESTVTSRFTADDVYEVSRIVSVGSAASATDYGVLELDRPVVGRTAYTSGTDDVSVGDNLVLIGHPIGLPKKFDSEGSVTTFGQSGAVFYGTVDSYGGNSGSPIFNSNGDLVGILTAGAPDFTYNDGCAISNVCPGGVGCDQGEEIVPICTLATSTSEVRNQLNFDCGDDYSTQTTDFSTLYTTDLSTLITTDLSTLITTDLSTFFTTDLSTFISTDFSSILSSIFSSDVTTITSFSASDLSPLTDSDSSDSSDFFSGIFTIFSSSSSVSRTSNGSPNNSPDDNSSAALIPTMIFIIMCILNL